MLNSYENLHVIHYLRSKNPHTPLITIQCTRETEESNSAPPKEHEGRHTYLTAARVPIIKQSNIRFMTPHHNNTIKTESAQGCHLSAYSIGR